MSNPTHVDLCILHQSILTTLNVTSLAQLSNEALNELSPANSTKLSLLLASNRTSLDGVQGCNGNFVYLPDPKSITDPFNTNKDISMIILTHTLTFILGFFGNLVVMATWARGGRIRSPTATFLVSLAFADLLMLVCFMPLETVEYFVVTWDEMGWLCKLSSFFELLSGMASSFNLVAVSVERFLVIVFPFKARQWCTATKSRRSLILVWLLAIVFAAPPVFNKSTYSMVYYNNETSVTAYYCFETSDTWAIFFSWYELIIIFAVPASIMTICYSWVIHELWTSRKVITVLSSSVSNSRHSLNTGMRLNKDGRSYLVRWPNNKMATAGQQQGRGSVPVNEMAATSSTTSTTTPSSPLGTTSGTPSNIGTSTSYSSSLPAGAGRSSSSTTEHCHRNGEPESPINLGQSVYASRWVKCLHNLCSLLRFKCLRRNRHRKRAAQAPAGAGHQHCRHRHRRRHRPLSRQPRVHRHQHFRFPSSGANTVATPAHTNNSTGTCANGNLIASSSNRLAKSNGDRGDHTSTPTETKRKRHHRVCHQMQRLFTCKECCAKGQTTSRDKNNNMNENNGNVENNVYPSKNEIYEMKSLPSQSTLGATGVIVSACQSYNMLNIHNQPAQPQQSLPEPVVNDPRKQLYCQIIKMLLATVVLFYCFWLPRLVFNVLNTAGVIDPTRFAYGFRVYFYLMSFIHSAINPFVYGFMSSSFRRMMFNACKNTNKRGRAAPVVNSLADAMATTSCINMAQVKASFSNNSVSRSRSNMLMNNCGVEPQSSTLASLASTSRGGPTILRSNEHPSAKRHQQLQVVEESSFAEQIEIELNEVVVESMPSVNTSVIPTTTNFTNNKNNKTNIDTDPCSLDLQPKFTFTSPSSSASSSLSIGGSSPASHRLNRSHSMFAMPEPVRPRHHRHGRLLALRTRCCRHHQQQQQNNLDVPEVLSNVATEHSAPQQQQQSTSQPGLFTYTIQDHGPSTASLSV